ncbi:MAG: hypothetical protein H0U95_06760 [Bacteroidetes bacterium]|nr:hypothetical protein [Bacteroidota bacterium]
MTKVHIGKKIQEIVDNSGFTIVAFAKSINLTRDGVYKIFKKEAIDTTQLQKISEVLKHDFFNYYGLSKLTHVRETKTDYGFATKEELADVTSALQMLSKEIAKLRDEMPKKARITKTKNKYSKKK